MKLFGLEIRRQKAAVGPTQLPTDTSADRWNFDGLRGWWPVVREGASGAWQRGQSIDRESVLRYGTVWSCITLIASDIAKLWINLVERDEDGICTPVLNSAYSPVLRKPNHYQTRVKFVESWQLSRLIHGNAYVLKERNHRGGINQGTVDALYVLDPARVKVLVSPSGDVFYELAADTLAGIQQAVIVPASEIIHDVCVPLFHPLCGVSPIFACGLAAMQGLRIQQNSSSLFENGSTLSGVLTAPNNIPDELAQRIREHWRDEFSGPKNVGKVAVLGSGMKFEPMVMTAVDAQLIEQLKWTREDICACFHVPGYMVGVGAAPPYTDIQSINLQYYTQALQNPIENTELLLEDGLELRPDLGIEFDLDALARMDAKTQTDVATKLVAGGIETPNEGRARFNRKPVPGGESPYLQQQNWSLADLAKRSQAGPRIESAPAPERPEPRAAADALSVTAIRELGATLLKHRLTESKAAA